MSHAFVNALKKNPKQSYVQLLNTIRDFLDEGGYSQKPQLSCSHPLGKFESSPIHVSIAQAKRQTWDILLHAHVCAFVFQYANLRQTPRSSSSCDAGKLVKLC